MTTNNEAFVKWYRDLYPICLTPEQFSVSTQSYELAKAECEKEIAELKAENSTLNDAIIEDKIMLEQLAELQSHINGLREALKEICMVNEATPVLVYQEMESIAKNALATTPAQSLAEHDNEVIERCAKVCDAMEYRHNSYDMVGCGDAKPVAYITQETANFFGRANDDARGVFRYNRYGISNIPLYLASPQLAERVKELEAEIARLNGGYYEPEPAKSKIAQLQADNARMREALHEAIGYIPAYTVNDSVVSKWREALATTPAQSLAEHDNEVIERCAKVCDEKSIQLEKKAEQYQESGEWDEVNNQRSIAWIVSVVAASIRKMKGK